MKFIITLIVLSAGLSPVHAKVLQEGWYQVLSGQQHVGYIVTRYEFDEVKKQFKFNSFMKTNALGGDVAESISAISTDEFAPVSYQYTTQMGKTVKLIDAAFKNGQMTAKITENGLGRTEQATLEKNTLLSYFLVYKILMGKSGIKDGLSFQYTAIAEEDAQMVKDGFVDIKSSEPFNGRDTFKVLNTFKGVKSISVITPIGETIQVRQPTTGLQLVSATKEDATKGFPSSEKTIKTLFGDIPKNSPLVIIKPASPAVPAATVPTAGLSSPQDSGVTSTLPRGTSVPVGKPFKQDSNPPLPNKEKND